MDIVQQYQTIDVLFEDSETSILRIYQYMAREDVAISETIYDFSDDPPGADAGPDQNASRGDLVTLDGSRSSYPLSGIKGYQWTQISGAPVDLSSRTAAKSTFTVPSASADGSAFAFELKITTNSSGPFTDATTVPVRSASGGRYRSISAEEAKDLIDTENDLIVVDVSDADEYCGTGGHVPCSENFPWDGGVLQSRYSELPRGSVIIVTAASSTKSAFAADFLAGKGYDSIYDMGSMSDWDWATATCDDLCNKSPIADAGDDFSADEGARIFLDGTGSSDPDGDAIFYRWSIRKGAALVSLSDTTSPTPAVALPDVGIDGASLTFRLEVTDNRGGTASDDVTVDISWVPAAGYNKISPQEAREMIELQEDVIVVDVREADEYCDGGGHIACALNYPWDSGVLQARYAELPMESDILIICNNGNRSAYAAEFLLAKGFSNIFDMGGIHFWPGETVSCDQPCDESPAAPPEENYTPQGFVVRFYTQALGRDADPAGLDGWTAAIENGSVTGADVARGFLISREFKNRGTTHEAFLNILFRTLMNMEAPAESFEIWLAELTSGTPRGDVLEAFISSEEFSNLAGVYGVAPYPMDPVEAFTTHFYQTALNRGPDADGLNGWVAALKSGAVSGADLAVSFLFSPEFLRRDLSDEVFLTILYETLLGRKPDSGGLQGWLFELGRGMSRAAVLDSFAESAEYAERCRQFGVVAVNPPGAV